MCVPRDRPILCFLEHELTTPFIFIFAVSVVFFFCMGWCFVLSYLVSSYLVLSCLIVSHLTSSCLALPCLVLSSGTLYCLTLSHLSSSCLASPCLVLSSGTLYCLTLSHLSLSCRVVSCLLLLSGPERDVTRARAGRASAAQAFGAQRQASNPSRVHFVSHRSRLLYDSCGILDVPSFASVSRPCRQGLDESAERADSLLGWAGRVSFASGWTPVPDAWAGSGKLTALFSVPVFGSVPESQRFWVRKPVLWMQVFT